MAVAYITPAKKTTNSVASLANPNEFTDAYDLVSVGTDGAYLARTFDSSNNVVDECKDQKIQRLDPCGFVHGIHGCK